MGKLNAVLERMEMAFSDDARGSAELCAMGSLFVTFILLLFLGIIWSSDDAGTDILRLILATAIVISVSCGIASAAYRYIGFHR